MKKSAQDIIKYFLTGKRAALLIILCIIIISGKNVCSVSREESSENIPGVYNLNFRTLEQVERYVTEDKTDLKEIPEDILVLNGKRVKITGYFLIPTEAYYNNKTVSDFAVSKGNYGCPCCSSWGAPPTIFNSVIVYMKEGTTVGPPFAPLIEVTGTFMVKKETFVDDDGNKRLNTLFYIKDAEAVKKTQSMFKSIF
jgi:hypothetical protein